MSWQSYRMKFTTSEYENPEGRVTMFYRGPLGGTQFCGNYTADELDQIALEAAHVAERLRSGLDISSTAKAA